MRTTLDLPQDLLKAAMESSHYRTKTSVIIEALEALIRKNKIHKIKEFKGKVKLDINLNQLRKRR